MNSKKTFYSEFAYLVGIFTLAIGTAFMERADFGMSMVVAPAYLVFLKLSRFFSWFTFGMAEYCLQAVLLVFTSVILRKFKPTYIFSFGTAVFYGIVLDFCMWCTALLPGETVASRTLFFFLGMLLCSLGVALLFHTYIAPEAYELLVKELSIHFNIEIGKVKTAYDCTSCLIAILLSFLFFGFGHFEGVKAGTIFCALTNGWIIGKISRKLDVRYDFIRFL